MRRHLLIPAIALPFCTAPYHANAECALVFGSPAMAGTISYDPFSAVPATVSLSLSAKNAGSKPCDGAVAFFTGGKHGLEGNSHSKLQFRIESGNGTDLLNPGETAITLPSGAQMLPLSHLAPGETRTIPLRAAIIPGQIVPPGSYVSRVEAGLYQRRQSGLSRAGQAITGQIFAHVPAVMSINIAGGGQHTTLDFGILSAGATRSVSLQARSNQGYIFSAASENRGTMVLDPPSSDGASWRIPYTVRINNGAETALGHERQIEIARTPTTLAGSTVPVEVKIGDVNGQRAGRYRDVIVIKISALP